MRWLVVLAATATVGYASAALAQSSTTTNCMMTCNAQAATCQSTCFVPAGPPLGSNTPPLLQAQVPGPNVTASTVCTSTCTTTQLTCQTACARNSSQGFSLGGSTTTTSTTGGN
jgi:hypothetical protein